MSTWLGFRMEDSFHTTITVTDYERTRKILAIKGLRGACGAGLREAKEAIETLANDGSVIRMSIPNGKVDSALAYLEANGLVAEKSFSDEIPPESTTLPTHELALKLAMMGMNPLHVEYIAQCIDGDEDAAGSFRAAAKMMKEVDTNA